MNEPVLDTGHKRALAREAERAAEQQERYENTTFPLNKRAERRRTLKALKKHEQAMLTRQRFRSVGLPKN